MSEAFPQQPQSEPEAFERRTGNVIRRRGVERPHKEETEPDYVAEYNRRYRNIREEKREEKFGMKTGKFFERILGVPDIETIINIALAEGVPLYEVKDKDGKFEGYSMQRRIKKGRWSSIDSRNLEKCFDIVKKHQGDNDPNNPQKIFPYKLRDAIVKIMNTKGDEKEISYFMSIKTPLDFSPDVGADAFFEIDGQIITIDVTEREEKGEILGADLLISEKDITMANEIFLAEKQEQKELAQKAYEQQINALAERIMYVYEQRIQKTA